MGKEGESNIISFRKKSRGPESPFVTDNERTSGRIMQLGHSFTQAVAEGEEVLAKEIMKEAQGIKDSAR